MDDKRSAIHPSIDLFLILAGRTLTNSTTSVSFTLLGGELSDISYLILFNSSRI